MGKLYKRNGTYYADYFDRGNVRRRVSTRTSDVAVARQRLRDLELATTDRAPNSSEAVTHALSYFVDVACAAKPEGTISSYRQKARHLARLLGETILDRLDRETIERYVAERLEEGAHRHSVHKELVVLRSALRSAHDRGRTTTSPDVVPKFRSGYTPRTTYLTPDQFLAVVDNLVVKSRTAKAGTLARRERLKRRRALYCLLIALASPRAGELEALTLGHIDRARGVLRIPKGKTIARVVAIHPVLDPWLEAALAEAEDEGRPLTDPLVDPWPNVRRDLPRACARAGVPRCTPNDLRRTFASWLVQAGTSLLVVSRLLGHSSTRMVDLVYGQLDEATLAAAIQRLPGGCDAGVSRGVPRPGTPGAGGMMASAPSIVNSVEESAISSSCLVPSPGIEPGTRGFSVLGDMAPKVSRRQRKLKAV